MNETRFPLCWPSGWARTPRGQYARARFKKNKAAANPSMYGGTASISVWDGVCRVTGELRALEVKDSDVIISTNIQTRNDGVPRSDRGEPSDHGVAVYWKNKKGKAECMAIDNYDRVADNLAAVAATLEALRAIKRHGGGAIIDRAFAGFAQLPAAIVTARPWREVFGVDEGARLTPSEVNSRYNALARKRHPDLGGTHEAMTELNEARRIAMAEAV
jgi:hypothetical protein